jgi:hypothetical protein
VAWSSVGPRACIPAVSCRVVPPMVTATTTPSDSLPARCDFPFDGIRTGCSTGRRPTGRGGEGLSSSRHHLPNVPRPIRRGVPQRCISRIFTPSMAFAVILPARLPLAPLTGLGLRRGRLRFMLRTARLLPPCGFRRWIRPSGPPPSNPSTRTLWTRSRWPTPA